MNATKTTTLVALALAAGLALTACTSTPAVAPEATTPAVSQPTQTTTPTPEVAETPAGLAVGDMVTNEGGSFVADLRATLPAGLRLVPIEGTDQYLVIDETQPLPAAYLDPLQAQLAAGFTDGDGASNELRTGHQVADTIESATGKTVVLYAGAGNDAPFGFYFESGPLADVTSDARKAAAATYLAAPPTSFEAMVAMVNQVAAGNGYDTTQLVFIQIIA